MLWCKKLHKFLDYFQKYTLLLSQNVDSWKIGQLQGIDETCVHLLSHPVEGLNLKSSSLPSSLSLSLMLPLNHQIEYPSGSCPLTKLDVWHHKMFLVGVLQHLQQVFLQLLSEKESPGDFLDLNSFFLPFVEVDLNIIPGSVPSVQTLD